MRHEQVLMRPERHQLTRVPLRAGVQDLWQSSFHRRQQPIQASTWEPYGITSLSTVEADAHNKTPLLGALCLELNCNLNK